MPGDCGVQRLGPKHFKGLREVKVYVPPGSSDLDKVSCLLKKANNMWQGPAGCPPPGNLGVNPRVPTFTVIRGNRPSGDTTNLSVETGVILDHATWDSADNKIIFNANEDWDCDSVFQIDVAAHEFGHAMGLCHDSCQFSGPTPQRSIMWHSLEPGGAYSISADHCDEIEKFNCDKACPPTPLTDDCPCCFFCRIPPLEDRCFLAPMLCGQGGYYEPPGGTYCIHTITTRTFEGTIEITYPNGTVVHTGVLDRQTFSDISCHTYGNDAGPGSGESALEGDGPMVFVRSRYADGASGHVPLTGLARDDAHGISEIHFWVDGQRASVQGLRLGLYDPYTCSENPAPSCDSRSRFEATLDVSGLADGQHTLQVLAINGRDIDPIPTFYELQFEVRNVGSCAGDTTPPAVSLTSPSDGETVQGTISVACSASDASEIAAVDLYAGGAWQQNDVSAPYVYTLDTEAFADGQLELGCRAEDICGNARFSPSVHVTVANGDEVTATFAPIDDTFAHQDNPDTVYGGYNFMRLRTIDGGHGRHGYMKFQVSGVVGPIVAARLRMRTQDTTIPEAIAVYKLGTLSWQEETLTWNNAPLDVLQMVAAPPPFEAETWHELDVTPLITGNGTYSFGLATGSNHGKLDLWTKESIYTPELEVVFVPSAAPPAPER